MTKHQEVVNISVTVPTHQLLESIAGSQTHEQAIDSIMVLDAEMADMDASITVLDKLLGSLRDEVAAGEGAEADLKRFDDLHRDMIKLLKAGVEA